MSTSKLSMKSIREFVISKNCLNRDADSRIIAKDTLVIFDTLLTQLIFPILTASFVSSGA